MFVQPSAADTDDEPVRSLGVHDSWWTVGAASVLACLTLAACAWISPHLHADPALHAAALFVHLAALVLGFGAVLAADYHGLLWITGRCTMRETVAVTGRLHLPIWAGLAGLVASGVILHPDLTAVPTRVKLALVLVLTLNGLQAGLLGRRVAKDTSATPRILAWAGATALISQACWWGAMVIGFSNTQS
ncbi:hypothetical protein [Embleya sp. NPDC050493]|uniref:hypothetical protein n=1 Tax=Embleya sp. NPDC050493 TaxID=3363989 RepID=UPI0037AE164C